MHYVVYAYTLYNTIWRVFLQPALSFWRRMIF